MCRLTLAWVTSENSTKQLECRHLMTRSSSLDPIFSAGLTAPVSRVDCPCPWFHANSLPAPLSNQLSFASPYHFWIRRDFRSKNPLSGFAPKQTKESSAWRATYIMLYALQGLFLPFTSFNVCHANHDFLSSNTFLILLIWLWMHSNNSFSYGLVLFGPSNALWHLFGVFCLIRKLFFTLSLFFFFFLIDSYGTLYSTLSLFDMHSVSASKWLVTRFSYLSCRVCLSDVSWRASNLFFFFTVCTY